MKIYGDFVGTLETVSNRGVRIGEVRLYCNSVLVVFFLFYFTLIILTHSFFPATIQLAKCNRPC